MSTRREREEFRRERAAKQEAKSLRWWIIGVGGSVLLAAGAYVSWNVMSNVEERERRDARWGRGEYTPEERAKFGLKD